LIGTKEFGVSSPDLKHKVCLAASRHIRGIGLPHQDRRNAAGIDVILAFLDVELLKMKGDMK